MTNFFQAINQRVKNWFIPLIIGIVLIILGIYTMTKPEATYLTLTIFFTWSFFFTGVMEIIFAITNKEDLENWGWHLTTGILQTLLGVFLFFNPVVSAVVLQLIIGLYALFYAFNFLSFAIKLKDYRVKNWGWVLTFSILAILFSFLLIFNPVFAGLSLVYFTGLSIILLGVTACTYSILLKKLKDAPRKISKELKDKYEDLKEEFYKELKD